MVNSRRHPLIDGLLMATMVISSFGVFMYVLAQTGTVSETCLKAGITDPAACDAYLSSLNTSTAGSTTTTTNTNTATGTTTNTTTTTVSCTDSDGRDILTQGYASTTSGVIYDSCIDAKQVREMLCVSNNAQSETIPCADGYACEQGRCVLVPQTTVVTCTDTDGGDVPGTAGYVTTGGQNFSDRCISSSVLEEQSCGATGLISRQLQCYSGFECRNSYCTAVTATTSTNTNTNTSTNTSSAVCGNSICEGTLGESTTSCPTDCPAATTTTTTTNSTACGNGTCEGALGESTTSCPTDCPAATTTTTTTTSVCTDTDGGKSYTIRGYVSFNGVGYPDFCTSSGELQEQFCMEGQRHYENKDCGDRGQCQEGKCVEITATETATTTSVKFVCGNGICEAALGETYALCAIDCGTQNTTAVTTQPTTTVASVCTDTDGGKAYETRGYVSLNGVGYPDFCTSAGELQEQFCDGSQRRYETRSCGDARRCQDGKCVTQTVTTTTAAVVETDDTDDTESEPETVVVYEPKIENYLPAVCVEKGISDATQCAALVKAGMENSTVAMVLPYECSQAGLTTREECEKYFATRSVVTQCHEAGITTAEACRQYLVEKTAAVNLDASCRTAGILTASACEHFMYESKVMAAAEAPTEEEAEISLPERCRQVGIVDEQTCSKFLAFSDLSLECLRAGIETKSKCSEFLNSRLVEPICASQGITDATACKEFVYGRMSSGVSCSGLTSGQCSLVIKERHLGAIVEINTKIGQIEDSLDEVSNNSGHIDFKKLEEDGDSGKLARLTEVLPIKSEGRQLLAIKSRQQVSVGEDDTVEAGASRVIAYDTDGDGITDDAEKRLGTNPESADSDNDGNWDKDELMAERSRLAPIDRAILDGKEIGQPLTEGETDPKLSVSLPEKTVDEEDGADTDGVIFEGTGNPGEVVTLYVYSELPVVVTTTVSPDGTWTYEFDDSLSDGKHEVYVAVNDDTGKVTRKSNPLSFLVRGASAATTAQAASEAVLTDISPFIAAQEAPSYDIRMFLGGGAALLLLAFGLIAALFRKPEQVQ